MNSVHPAVPITSFTQEDINSGHIWFVHRGSPNGRLALRVSDGVETGATAVLRISAFDLQIFLANNSALMVPTNGYRTLHSSNLAFTTNAPEQGAGSNSLLFNSVILFVNSIPKVFFKLFSHFTINLDAIFQQTALVKILTF